MVFFNSHSNSMMIAGESNTTQMFLNISVDEYRQELSDQMAITLLPAIIILGTLLLVGIVGNSLVFYIYLFKVPPSATRPTILALACFDLLACFVSIPGEIMDIRFSYNFMSGTLCKVLRLSTFIFLIASGLTLLLVALDRYHRICHPLRNQIKPRDAWRRVGGAIVAALVLSALAPVVYNNKDIETPTPGIMGTECSTDPAFKKAAFVYGIFLGLVFLTTFTIMTVAYIFIARRVLRQNRFRTTAQQRKPEPSKSGDQLTTGNNNASDVLSSSHENRSFEDKDTTDITTNLDATRASFIVRYRSSLTRKPSIFGKLESNHLDATTRKTTLMLFLITMIFVIGFMPHLIISIMQTATKSLHSHDTSDANNIAYNIFIRSYFLNTATNPFIYGFCSPLFRRECKKLILDSAFWSK